MTDHDNVNNPRHYAGLREAFDIDVIDLIEAMAWGYHLGNVVKYLFRHEYKGNAIEDLKKAAWYLDRHIKHLEEDDEFLRALADGELELEAAKRDAYGRVLRASPPVNIDGEEFPAECWTVTTSEQRIAGDDEAGERIKNDYYKFNPFEIVGYCANCDIEIDRRASFVSNVPGYDSSLKFCSDKCVNTLREWQEGAR